MKQDLPTKNALDAEMLAFVAEKSLLAIELDAEADRSRDPDEAARLHAMADQARALADLEIKLSRLSTGRS